MPVWAWVAIGVGVALIGAAVAAGVWFGLRALERRMLLKLVVRAEAVDAASQALVDVVERLSVAADEEIEEFADDPDSTERRTLAEVRSRGMMLADELDHMAMPKKLVPAADALADAAFVLAREAGCVTDEDTGPEALDKLGSLDLSGVVAYGEKARNLIAGACDACGLQETAVYGGGLYL